MASVMEIADEGLQRFTSARTLVVKIGSALLVDADTGDLRADWLASLAEDIAALRRRGIDVVIVSSGSIALGRRALKLPRGALTLDQSQAAAAVGQIRLARAYEQALAPYGVISAQVLLTLDDTQNRRRYLNARATLKALLANGVTPVVNENDTVATDEIRYGDNDRLGALVAQIAGADALILLSDVDGLYDKNPRDFDGASHIPVVRDLTPSIQAMAGGSGTEGAKGGMITKLLAAKTAMRGGCAMAITKGAVDHPLSALEKGATATWFLPREDAASAKKQWIAGMKPVGALIVDDGAARALERGKSLLPAGVKRVEGAFQRGDPVAIRAEDGAELGAALVAYSVAEAQVIAGRQSGDIEELLGYPGRAAMAHRDDMVLWRGV